MSDILKKFRVRMTKDDSRSVIAESDFALISVLKSIVQVFNHSDCVLIDSVSLNPRNLREETANFLRSLSTFGENVIIIKIRHHKELLMINDKRSKISL